MNFGDLGLKMWNSSSPVGMKNDKHLYMHYFEALNLYVNLTGELNINKWRA